MEDEKFRPARFSCEEWANILNNAEKIKLLGDKIGDDNNG